MMEKGKHHPKKGNRTHTQISMGTAGSRKKDNELEEPPCYPITETILGIKEMALVGLGAAEREERFVRKGCFFVNETTGHLTSFGTFSTPTVESLRQQVADMTVHPKNQDRTRPPLSTRSGVDIGNLQGRLTTADQAMVQVASNFNCLENPSRHSRLDTGRFVDLAYLDCTQGPAAVFGTTSAYLYRCHFFKGGQSLGPEHCVNLLQSTKEYFGTPQNGKLTLTGNETILQNDEQINEAAAKVCIGLHQDCPVLFGRTDESLVYNQPTVTTRRDTTGSVEDDDNMVDEIILEYPLVDHVLNASINMHDFGASSQHLTTDQAMTNLTRALLRAAYEGIYLAAILQRRKQLYLTLVGGGCFGNPISMIVQEIQRAHEMYASHPASVLEECVICLYSREDELCVMDALKNN